jgi:hypothetical protein
MINKLAPRVPVAELPMPHVPSSKVRCAKCGTECWSSDSSIIPGLKVTYICFPDFEALARIL